MREALVHELMHSVEGRGGYEAYKEAAMQAAYHGNRADMQHDIERIQEVYGAVYEREGRTLTETDVQKELVTRATEKVIEQLAGWTKTGGETADYDLLGEKQAFRRAALQPATQFIAKRKAKKTARWRRITSWSGRGTRSKRRFRGRREQKKTSGSNTRLSWTGTATTTIQNRLLSKWRTGRTERFRRATRCLWAERRRFSAKSV